MDNDAYLEKANILIEALPYMQRLNKKTIVIKYGGNAMTGSALIHSILQDVVLLKYVGVNPILVHGGGPEISRMLELMEIPSSFHNGLRITSAPAADVAQMVLTGKINKEIVSQINALGGKAVGLCGKDGSLIRAEKMEPQDGVDLGYVGRVTGINSSLLQLLAEDEYIPVIAPVGYGPDGSTLNINGDTAAAEIAAALKAEKLIFLTDIDGIRLDPKDPATLIPEINAAKTRALIEQGVIGGGMIPKVEGCLRALEAGVQRTHIVNGAVLHPLLLEIYTDEGNGTMVVA